MFSHATVCEHKHQDAVHFTALESGVTNNKDLLKVSYRTFKYIEEASQSTTALSNLSFLGFVQLCLAYFKDNMTHCISIGGLLHYHECIYNNHIIVCCLLSASQ